MNEEYADIYYVDTRNAEARDHRSRTGSSPGGWRPLPPGGRQVVVHTPPAAPAYPTGYAQPVQPAYPAPYPLPYPGQGYPNPFVPRPALGSLFGGMPVGQILDLVAKAFAALAPLPQAPTATRETNTDVGNLITYQNALAEHAKRDERIRTIGALVGKLVG
ncbi:MAG TPA: hypothetical protein VK427_27025 [Kofleriaceae bacterium]|nr:hypothetical protein [Kofleriaceae bacterium]